MGRETPAKPSAPGWYPDPWSADGRGERYWDGKRWGGSDRADHPTITRPAKRSRVGRAPRSERSSPRGKDRRRSVVGILILVAIVVATVYVQRRGSDSSGEQAAASASRPPAGADSSDNPLGRPAPVPAGSGGHEYFATQAGRPKVPVAWDPCRPVHYVINPAGAPADGAALVKEAVATLSRATGLRFVYDGTTDERPNRERSPFQPNRYGDERWAPVLVAWSNERDYPELSGYIAGVAGPRSYRIGDAPEVYISGQVVLDGEQLSSAAAPDRADVRAVILHELGHLAGLAHTSDSGQLMYSEATRNVRDYQVGDLQGLAELGSQECVPEV